MAGVVAKIEIDEGVSKTNVGELHIL